MGTSARERSIPWPLIGPRECGAKAVEHAKGGEEIAWCSGVNTPA